MDADDSPDSFRTPKLLSNQSSMLSHSLGLHTQSVPCTKKYLFFEFLLESGMSNTNLNNGFYSTCISLFEVIILYIYIYIIDGP